MVPKNGETNVPSANDSPGVSPTAAVEEAVAGHDDFDVHCGQAFSGANHAHSRPRPRIEARCTIVPSNRLGPFTGCQQVEMMKNIPIYGYRWIVLGLPNVSGSGIHGP
jgi:hypothetical protein